MFIVLNSGKQIMYFAALVFTILVLLDPCFTAAPVAKAPATAPAKAPATAPAPAKAPAPAPTKQADPPKATDTATNSGKGPTENSKDSGNSDIKKLQADVESLAVKLDSFYARFDKLDSGLEQLTKALVVSTSQKSGVPGTAENKDAGTTSVSQTAKFTGCSQLDRLGNAASGVYQLQVQEKTKDVYCDMETDGGGWTVIQRREETMGPKINFSRDWAEYEDGFGSVNSTFWIGLKTLANLTKHWDRELRIDIEDWDGKWTYAKYNTFFVAGSNDKYKLNVEGYSGNAGDSLSYHNNQYFSTADEDNDNDGRNCAEIYKGGWWYSACHYANLNGKYYVNRKENTKMGTGIVWYYWKYSYYYSLKTVEMKIRYKH